MFYNYTVNFMSKQDCGQYHLFIFLIQSASLFKNVLTLELPQVINM